MSAYLVRARSASLDRELSGVVEDTLFANQRFDEGELAGVHFQHCTFANVSFKRANVRECHFSNCVFEACYFRETKLIDCNFPASRFIDCEFPKPTVYGCSFRTTRFRRTLIPFEIMEPNLPGEPNLCRDLCENLATEAVGIGRARAARNYRLRAITEHQEALRRGYRWTDEYSKQHYPELQRVTAFFRLVGSKLAGVLWGHGERIRRLLANLAILGLAIGPGLLYLVRDHLHHSQPLDYGDYVALTFASLLNNSGASSITATGVGLAVVLALTASGLLFLGLLVTYLFRAVTSH